MYYITKVGNIIDLANKSKTKMIVLLFFNNTNSRIKAISVTVTHNYPEAKY